MAKIYVVGIGFKPLDKKSRKIITHSDFILSSSRLIKVFKRYEDFERVKDRIYVIDNVDKTIEFIKSKIKKQKRCGLIITVLASGDPLFFGIGRRIIREIGKERVEVIPDLSSIQIAFSRIKESWDDAFLLSLYKSSDFHDKKDKRYEIKDIPLLIKRYKKIAILTDPKNNPENIANAIISSSLFQKNLPAMYVCERLGYADERIIKVKPNGIIDKSFLEPNVVIIVNKS